MKGIIYKVSHKKYNICYVGSTVNSEKNRFSSHKCNQIFNCSINKYINKYDRDDFIVSKIKEYTIFDKKQLLAYEQLWINKLNTINQRDTISYLKHIKNNKYRNSTKVKEYQKEYQKEYRRKNKNITKEKQKKYRKQRKEYYEKNKKIKIKCECGLIVSKAYYKKHQKTKKHQKLIGN